MSEFGPWILGMKIFESLEMKDKEGYRVTAHTWPYSIFCVCI